MLKNRDAAPGWADFDPAITLAAILAPGNDISRWSTSQAASITGYVIDVHPGGIETVNCHARDLAGRDTHIEIALNPGAPETARMIVEVTPRWRARMASVGIDWSTATLERALTGHWVTFTGWMLYDAEHVAQSENTAPGRASDWRATAWEIHPVTWIAYAPAPVSAPAPATMH